YAGAAKRDATIETVQRRHSDWNGDRLSGGGRNCRRIGCQRKAGCSASTASARAGTATAAGQIALIQQNTDCAVAEVCHRQVWFAIAVKIRRPHRERARTCWREIARRKCSSAGIKGDDCLVAELVCRQH